jgi:hypothetical protein
MKTIITNSDYNSTKKFTPMSTHIHSLLVEYTEKHRGATLTRAKGFMTNLERMRARVRAIESKIKQKEDAIRNNRSPQKNPARAREVEEMSAEKLEIQSQIEVYGKPQFIKVKSPPILTSSIIGDSPHVSLPSPQKRAIEKIDGIRS